MMDFRSVSPLRGLCFAGVIASAVLTGAVLMPGAGGAQAGLAGVYAVSFSGDPHTHVTGYCDVGSPSGGQKHLIESVVPFDLILDGHSLTCEITADGPLEVETSTPNGNHGKNRTSGGTMTFSLGDRP